MKKAFLVIGILLVIVASILVGIKIDTDKKEQQRIEKEKEIR